MLVKRSFSLAGHRTSVALESEFWIVLTAMAAAAGESLATLVTRTDHDRAPDQNLASRLRVAALRHADGGTILV